MGEWDIEWSLRLWNKCASRNAQRDFYSNSSDRKDLPQIAKLLKSWEKRLPASPEPANAKKEKVPAPKLHKDNVETAELAWRS